MVLPVIAVIGLAFSNWTGFNVHDVSYAGLANFRALPHDELFVRALLHTVAFVVALDDRCSNILGFSLAMLIDSRVQGHDFLRIAMFVPLGLSPGDHRRDLAAAARTVRPRELGRSTRLLVSSRSPVQFLGDPDLAILRP